MNVCEKSRKPFKVNFHCTSMMISIHRIVCCVQYKIDPSDEILSTFSVHSLHSSLCQLIYTMKMYALSTITVVDFISASVIFVVRVSLLHESTINCRSFSTSIATALLVFPIRCYFCSQPMHKTEREHHNIRAFHFTIVSENKKRRILSVRSV